MNSPGQLLTIEEALREFEETCINCSRADVAEDVTIKLKSAALRSEVFNRSENGNIQDLESFVEEQFSIPLGLRLSLVRSLRNFFKQRQQHRFTEPDKEKKNTKTIECSDNSRETLFSIYHQWKNGKVMPDEYISNLNYLVHSQQLAPHAAQRLIAIYLHNGGHQTIHPSSSRGQAQGEAGVCPDSRVSMTTSICDLMEVSKLTPHMKSFATELSSIEVYTEEGVCFNIFTQPAPAPAPLVEAHQPEKIFNNGHDHTSPGLNKLAMSPLNYYPEVSSCGSLFWVQHRESNRSSRAGDDLLLVAGEDYKSATGASEGRAPYKPVLVIGDSISIPGRGMVHMNTVLSVCSLNSNGDDNFLSVDEERHIGILVEGRATGHLARGSGFSTNVSKKSTSSVEQVEAAGSAWSDCDGASEIAEDAEMEGDMDSGDEQEHNMYRGRCDVIPNTECQHRYYILTASAYRQVIKVRALVELCESADIFLDQVPTTLSFLEEGLLVVHGTNGLLATVTAAQYLRSKQEEFPRAVPAPAPAPALESVSVPVDLVFSHLTWDHTDTTRKAADVPPATQEDCPPTEAPSTASPKLSLLSPSAAFSLFPFSLGGAASLSVPAPAPAPAPYLSSSSVDTINPLSPEGSGHYKRRHGAGGEGKGKGDEDEPAQEESSAVPSHSFGSQITCVSYSPIVGTLATGDSNGTICLWRVGPQAGRGGAGEYSFDPTTEEADSDSNPNSDPRDRGRLLVPPLKVNDARINSLLLLPSGETLIVALHDRLLLLAMNPPLTKAQAGRCLYVRSLLDMVPGGRVRYSLSVDSTHIRVWRFARLADTPATPTLPQEEMEAELGKRSGAAAAGVARVEDMESTVQAGPGTKMLVSTWKMQQFDALCCRHGEATIDDEEASLIDAAAVGGTESMAHCHCEASCSGCIPEKSVTDTSLSPAASLPGNLSQALSLSQHPDIARRHAESNSNSNSDPRAASSTFGVPVPSPTDKVPAEADTHVLKYIRVSGSASADQQHFPSAHIHESAPSHTHRLLPLAPISYIRRQLQPERNLAQSSKVKLDMKEEEEEEEEDVYTEDEEGWMGTTSGTGWTTTRSDEEREGDTAALEAAGTGLESGVGKLCEPMDVTNSPTRSSLLESGVQEIERESEGVYMTPISGSVKTTTSSKSGSSSGSDQSDCPPYVLSAEGEGSMCTTVTSTPVFFGGRERDAVSEITLPPGDRQVLNTVAPLQLCSVLPHIEEMYSGSSSAQDMHMHGGMDMVHNQLAERQHSLSFHPFLHKLLFDRRPGMHRSRSRDKQGEGASTTIARTNDGAATTRVLTDLHFMDLLLRHFGHDRDRRFTAARACLAIVAAAYHPPSLSLLSTVLECSLDDCLSLLGDLSDLLELRTRLDEEGAEYFSLASDVDDIESWVVVPLPHLQGLRQWLCSTQVHRMAQEFWIDVADGHNMLCSLYLRFCGNKSVAVEHPWQEYLREYGPKHFRRCSRGLKALTRSVRKIDETANIKGALPRQIGFIEGLREIYARRVGLGGILPSELGQLSNLRVLSMGNNNITGQLPASLCQLKNLQRIVLHQNNLFGDIPPQLSELGCIVNLAGNPNLNLGPDVPFTERRALDDLYRETMGHHWTTRTNWNSTEAVSKWYKVGVLGSHVHSIVMSSNGMRGQLPSSVSSLTQLRMIEFATMPDLVGPLPTSLCSITTLRRLCICRCGINGRIPHEIGQLVGLEELQLFGNKLVGSIPASLGKLKRLKLLSLGEYTGGNDFAPRNLPSCLSQLTSLEALFMANCNITGALPAWLGQLKELRQLDLQKNRLQGTLSASIGQLQNLLYLNVKDNERLQGPLPLASLCALKKLNRLSLVHCHFSDMDNALVVLREHLPRCKVWI